MNTTQELDQAYELHKSGKLQEAADLYQKLLKSTPDHPRALFLLGTLCVQAGQAQRAIPLLQRSSELDPNHADTFNSLGQAALHLGAFQKAKESFEKSLEINPKNDIYWNNLANALSALRDWNGAMKAYSKAHEIKPEQPAYVTQAAHLARRMGHFDAATKAFQGVLSQLPKNELALSGLGQVYLDQFDFETADRIFADMERFHPEQLDATLLRARTALQQRKLKEARDFANQATTKNAQHPEPHNILAEINLLESNFTEAWKEYDWRLASLPLPAWKTIPIWKGESFAGKRVLVCGEQNIGFQILASSTLPDLIRDAKHVSLILEDRLVPLFENAFPKATLVAYSKLAAFKPEADVQIPLGTLMRAYRHSTNQFPKQHWLNLADSPRSPKTKPLRIGMVWRTFADFKKDANPSLRLKSSIPLKYWQTLMQIPGTKWTSLQYGPVAQEFTDVPVKPNIPEFDLTHDQLSLAKQIQNLDLVIGINSAPTLLACALGCPTWILSEFNPSPFVGLDDVSPFLPNARVYQQSTPGDWSDTLNTVFDALKNFVG